jgi:hypothetical protein
MKVTGIETLHCDGGWRNYSFVKLTTDEGIVGWSEYDEGFGSPGVTAAIERLAERVVGEDVSAHERIYAKLYGVTRPATGGVVAEAMGAIENALLDAKAKRLGLPCYELLGGKQRDRIAHRDRSTCRKADFAAAAGLQSLLDSAAFPGYLIELFEVPPLDTIASDRWGRHELFNSLSGRGVYVNERLSAILVPRSIAGKCSGQKIARLTERPRPLGIAF